MLDALALPPEDAMARRLAELDAESGVAVPLDWCNLSAALVRWLNLGRPRDDRASQGRRASPVVLAVSGGQGAGKTTLSRRLVQALRAAGSRAAACSLDDFYLTRAERVTLAQRVHPLLETRGVPGTHDVTLLQSVLDGLGGNGEVALPLFDKAADDRLPEDQWPVVTAPLDVLVLEGWCLGAEPQAADELAEPINPLEAVEDRDGRWRGYVNEALTASYAGLWARFDRLVYLAVPDMAAVVRWRGEQEQALPPERRMSRSDLGRFIAHYERVTRQMARTLPEGADLVVELDGQHAVAGLRRPSRAA